MPRYYRIQPAGLGLDHNSESSNGVVHGVDVFEYPLDTLNTDASRESYGDEVVVIEAAEHWANGDVEGVRIDGRGATVVARYPWSVWLRELAERAGYEADLECSDEDWEDELRHHLDRCDVEAF